jgi:hypothetical protein
MKAMKAISSRAARQNATVFCDSNFVRVYRIVVVDRRMGYVYVRLTTVRDLDVGQFRVLCYRYRR